MPVVRFALVSLVLAVSLQAQIPEGDQHYAARAEGAMGGRASATRIDAAIEAYQKAIAQNPGEVEARARLLRALRFKGAYVATTNEQKRVIYDRARKIGNEAIAILTKNRKDLARAPEKEAAVAMKDIPHAAEVFYWDSVAWGEWALAYGKMAAVREGAADRIKRSSTLAMLIDPKLDGGGGQRVLGRLHHETPRVPFVTGWASNELAVKYLQESVAIDPTNKVSKVFLAEALVSDDKRSKPKAVAMLQEVISSPNDPAFSVENAAAQDDARKLLAAWK